MGAYENPAIIRDTSGQIYGQAIASFGQSIAKGISIYGQKAQEANKKAQEKIERHASYNHFELAEELCDYLSLNNIPGINNEILIGDSNSQLLFIGADGKLKRAINLDGNAKYPAVSALDGTIFVGAKP